MGKKVIITGSTGMVGNEVLKHCLADDRIDEVISFTRNPSNMKSPKLTEIIPANFKEYDQYSDAVSGVDIVFYCLGVYTGNVSKELFREITVDYPVELAKAIARNSTKVTFCLLSGSGADRSEKSRMMFARDKGAVENQLSAIGFNNFHAFRPGYIYPVERRKEPNFFYKLSRTLYPLIRLLGQDASIKSTELARAMFNVGMEGAAKEILENRSILNQL